MNEVIMPHKSVDIAFMFPPGMEFHSYEEPLFVHHLGVAYIQAYLSKYGFTSKQVIPPLGSTLKDCIRQIIATGAKIIGFTCYDHNYYMVRTIATQIKRAKPDIIVIAGGPTATFSDRLLLANTPDINMCVRFEGEETTLKLIELGLEGLKKGSLEDIEGISFRRDCSIIRTPDRKFFGCCDGTDCSLDGLPSPYLEGILRGTEGAGVISARGCTHHCTYCNFSAMSKHTIRYHSIDRVISELRQISEAIESDSKNPWPQVIAINDDAFALNIRRAKKICERIIDEGIKLRLSCLSRANNFDEELIGLLKQAGFVEIAFGVESAAPKVLNAVKKVRKNDENFDNGSCAREEKFLWNVKEIINLAKLYGMKIGISIILGLPGETIADGLKTVNFVRSLGVDTYEQNYLNIFPGTELFLTANKYNIKYKASEFLLPYETQYAYPVENIPFGENSSLQAYSRRLPKIVLKTFAGGPDTYSGIKNRITLVSIECYNANSLSKSIDWLSRNISVGGRIVIRGKENNTIDDFDSMLNMSFRFGLPTNECYYLRSCSILNSEFIYEVINKPLHGKLLQWNPRFPLILISRSLEFGKTYNTSSENMFPIYFIKDKKDVDFLIYLADKLATRANSGKIKPGIFLDGVFLDGCRWCQEICPALKLRRIVINQCEEILPCLTGQPLGNIYNDVQDLRSHAKKIYALLREERKCEKCPADLRCSKCLFPYPLSQEEYCELQRTNLNISGIVTRSNLVNTEDFS